MPRSGELPGDPPRRPDLREQPSLVDTFGRAHRSLRLSVTDRCNLRCRYCMPASGMPWIPNEELLSDDEIVELVTVLAQMGMTDLRLTGGEPLVRPGLADLVRRLRAIPEVRELSLTTNGVLLEDAIDELVDAGLDRVNISVDSLDPDRFAALTRRRDLARALAGLAACERHPGLGPIKVNAVAVRGISEPDVLPLARMARERPYIVRFIEVMPLDAPRAWQPADVLSGAELRAMIERRWKLVPEGRDRPAAPATRWRFADGAGALEFVSPITEPFCASCDRLRLTADGQLRTCLFAEWETDLRTMLRSGVDRDVLRRAILDAVQAKGAGHGLGDPGYRYEGRPMSMIGG